MSPKHALVIDDDSNNLEVLEGLLDDAGVTCTPILDPADLNAALQALKRLDVVFVDLELPTMDGYEILDILKNDIGLTVPIVACTVHTSEAANARRKGFDSFLGKPLDSMRFPDQLRRILNNETVWDAR